MTRSQTKKNVAGLFVSVVSFTIVVIMSAIAIGVTTYEVRSTKLYRQKDMCRAVYDHFLKRVDCHYRCVSADAAQKVSDEPVFFQRGYYVDFQNKTEEKFTPFQATAIFGFVGYLLGVVEVPSRLYVFNIHLTFMFMAGVWKLAEIYISYLLDVYEEEEDEDEVKCTRDTKHLDLDGMAMSSKRVIATAFPLAISSVVAAILLTIMLSAATRPFYEVQSRILQQRKDNCQAVYEKYIHAQGCLDRCVAVRLAGQVSAEASHLAVMNLLKSEKELEERLSPYKQFALFRCIDSSDDMSLWMFRFNICLTLVFVIGYWKAFELCYWALSLCVRTRYTMKEDQTVV